MDNYTYNNPRQAEPSLWSIWTRTALRLWDSFRVRRGLVFGVILVVALAAFEIFNFSTTDFALTDLLGELKFAGLRWATILAIAFCGIDFAGLARLFTPERGVHGHPVETWYLIGAWFLGATMNAMMTWWAVSLAMIGASHQIGNEILSREQLLAYVPVFVAALVWLTRILIIGTFSVAGDRLFSQAEAMLLEVRNQVSKPRPASVPAPRPATQSTQPARVIGGAYGEDEWDEPAYVRSESRPRPVTTTPPPAATYRPIEQPRPATRPAPKPAFRPAQSMSARPGEPGSHANSGNGRS